VLSVTGLAASFAIPAAPASAPGLRVGWNLPAETVRLVRLGHARPEVWLCITGIGWFWAIGALVLAEFPVIAKDVLGGGPDVVTLLLTMFSIGVGVGSVGCSRLLHGRVSARLAPWAAVGISVFALDFAFAVSGQRMADAAAVLGSVSGWRMLGDLLLLAACGGAYSVPLYAVMQVKSRPGELSRMIGCNNVMNAVYMVVAAVIAGGLAAASVGSPRILQLMAGANLVFAAWLWRQVRARGL
jgi:acyl-[acyl-carrier-protein]-phospholipid O-acyltransferase/long-chain-fatty-acid--[acyl-carrier-protein] ligase